MLGEEVLEPIYRYLEARGRVADDAPLFAGVGNRNRGGRMTTSSISRIVREAMRRAGIERHGITSYSLRHTTATLMQEGGASYQAIAKALGHKSYDSTRYYVNAPYAQDAYAIIDEGEWRDA